VGLDHIAEIDGPTAMAVREGDRTLYVAQQGGEVVAVRDGDVDDESVLDLSNRVSDGYEQGLLGLAFSPDGERMYVNFTNDDGDTRIVEYPFLPARGGVGRADDSSRRVILRIDQPAENHNGGQLAFGPDGMLYIGTGDGGSGADDNGQSLDTLLGKILRIDPTPTATKPYTIPLDNPFAAGGGRPEIWAYGLRNPWRFSFDPPTSTIWIADVGQDEVEEINVAPATEGGINYGWNVFEGRRRYRKGTAPGHHPPLVGLPRDDGYCSVIGGYVYRGNRIPDLEGWYVYTDFCNGQLRAVRVEGERVERQSLGAEQSEITSFGQGNDGTLFVLSQSEGLSRIVAG
jgi:glucose/arabinose dehydrogenase